MLDETDVNYHREITGEVAEQIRRLIPDMKHKKILVAGIGTVSYTHLDVYKRQSLHHPYGKPGI